jgi:hypothetical protein
MLVDDEARGAVPPRPRPRWGAIDALLGEAEEAAGIVYPVAKPPGSSTGAVPTATPPAPVSGRSTPPLPILVGVAIFGLLVLTGVVMILTQDGRATTEWSAPSSRSKIEDRGEWMSLFNGRDLSGWKFQPGGFDLWKVEQGMIIGRGPMTFLFSEKNDYENFHVRSRRVATRGVEVGLSSDRPSSMKDTSKGEGITRKSPAI